MNTKLIVRYAIREVLGLVGMGVALFWSAGRIDWWPAWAALAVMAGWIIATAIIIFRSNPDLLAERLGPRKGAKPWDTAIMSILGLVQLVRYIVAGLDQRYGWTGGFPLAAQLAAWLVPAPWAMPCSSGRSPPTPSSRRSCASSPNAATPSSQAARTDFVRHPAYLGAILYELAVPLLLASWWSMIVSALGAFLLLLRTALEDRTLQAELAGYADYARQVRYRLLPGVW